MELAATLATGDGAVEIGTGTAAAAPERRLVRVNGDWSYRADARTVAVRLTQRDQARLFSMPLQVAVYAAGSATPTITTVQLSEASHEFQIPAGQRPDRVVLDPNHLVLMESVFAAATR